MFRIKKVPTRDYKKEQALVKWKGYGAGCHWET